MTSNPEKIPTDLLIRDYDVNAYIEKKNLSPFSTKLTVLSLLKTYQDIMLLEQAIVTLENVAATASEMSLPELLIDTCSRCARFCA